MVTAQSMLSVLRELGIKEGDSVLVHSSFKSLGEVEEGAKTVIDAFEAAVGKEGTLVFPTLCMTEFDKVYETWHIDKPSDAGYLTNYFRLLDGAVRSNQATHSVAARGKHAKYLTETHGETGKRYGIYGDTPFSADSPWEKMYHMNTKVVMIGVDLRKCTFRHYVEYCYMEKALDSIRDRADYEEMRARVWHYDEFDKKGAWPHIDNLYVADVMEREGKLHRIMCGEAELTMVESADFVETARALFDKKVPELIREPSRETFWQWERDVRA